MKLPESSRKTAPLHAAARAQLAKIGLSEWNVVNNVSGAFGAFRRSFLQKIGGWDTHTAEDLDITLRIKNYFGRRPLRIPFEPRAIGHTDAPVTFRQFLMQRLRWDGDLFFLYVRKHRHSFTPRLLGWREDSLGDVDYARIRFRATSRRP